MEPMIIVFLETSTKSNWLVFCLLPKLSRYNKKAVTRERPKYNRE